VVEEGFEAVLSRKVPVRPSLQRAFDGEREAWLVSLAWSELPQGHAPWSLRLLESKVVELGIVERASDSIQPALKSALEPRRRQYSVIPPKANDRFVAAMENALAVYIRERAPIVRSLSRRKPQSSSLPGPCPMAMAPGRRARVDCEYVKFTTQDARIKPKSLYHSPSESGC
jgi:hypothetical protein